VGGKKSRFKKEKCDNILGLCGAGIVHGGKFEK
jgi:hypothetical protein